MMMTMRWRDPGCQRPHAWNRGITTLVNIPLIKKGSLPFLLGRLAGHRDSFNLPGIGIYLDPREREELGEASALFTRYHEEGHFLRGFRRMTSRKQRQEEECAAQRHAIKMMISRGYTWEQLLSMEVRYRLWEKFGTRSLAEFQEVMLHSDGGGFVAKTTPPPRR